MPLAVANSNSSRSTVDGSIASGAIRLAYSIDFPSGTGPFPAVVFGHGSGRMTRQQLQPMAQQFTARGFAVLRFDKRGVGESTGVYSGVGVANSFQMFDDLSSDVVAAVRFLRTQPRIDGRRVGLFGVSQAGWILPVAAKELGDAAFMVLWSGPVCTVGEENYYSDLAEETDTPLESVYAQMPRFNGPHGFDPVPVLRAVQTPSYWLLGLDDRSIPIRTTLDHLQSLHSAGKPFQWKTYAGLGHNLSFDVWQDIGAWLEPFRAPR
jgi:pimeloyl-ACP methyl ester carboxylesterase